MKLFNRINIYNIENEDPNWRLIFVVLKFKHSHLIEGPKHKFSKICFKMEKKLKKTMKILIENSSQAETEKENAEKKRKLLVSGLLFLELICHEDKELFQFFNKLSVNKTSLKEFDEARKFIIENSRNKNSKEKNLKENIEEVLQHKFNKKMERTGRKSETSKNLSNFNRYLKQRIYEITEELVIFEDGTNFNQGKTIPIENFIDDKQLKEFIRKKKT